MPERICPTANEVRRRRYSRSTGPQPLGRRSPKRETKELRGSLLGQEAQQHEGKLQPTGGDPCNTVATNSRKSEPSLRGTRLIDQSNVPRRLSETRSVDHNR